jgi:ankyrin repeat protein
VQGTAQKPVEVSADEAASHRVGSLRPIPLHLVGGPGHGLQGQRIAIPITVVVGPDGSVVSAALSDEIDFDDTDPDVPEQWTAEFKKVAAEAQAEAGALQYRPFQRNGHAVFATFEEDVPCVPPDMLPGPHVNFPEVHNWNSLRIYLERTSCFGTCPSYSIEVYGDGTVLYNGKYYVAVLGQHRGQVSQQAVLSMLDAFRAADFFSLHDSYREAVTDNPTFTTSIQFDGHSKRVVDYVGRDVGMPTAVTELEDTIDQLADSARWTKGDAATVMALEEESWNVTSQAAADTLARVAMYGSADAVRELVAAGVPLNGHDDMGDSPLGRAASRGDLDMLRFILEGGADSDPAAMSNGLSQAAAAGSLDCVELLIKAGANPNARPDQAGRAIVPGEGDPPIVAAASSGVPAVVEEILKYHPDISARGRDNRTALIAAVDANDWVDGRRHGVDRLSVVRLLLAAGAKVDARDEKGSTALIKNASNSGVAAVLLRYGADVNASNNEGRTPLFSASSADLTRFLLQHGANLNVRDKDGRTPLECAKQNEHPETVAVLEAAQAAAKQ